MYPGIFFFFFTFLLNLFAYFFLFLFCFFLIVRHIRAPNGWHRRRHHYICCLFVCLFVIHSKFFHFSIFAFLSLFFFDNKLGNLKTHQLYNYYIYYTLYMHVFCFCFSFSFCFCCCLFAMLRTKVLDLTCYITKCVSLHICICII